MDQLSEFKESLDNMVGGNLSLVDQLNGMQLVSHFQFFLFFFICIHVDTLGVTK